jgi:hypothetical protein
VVAANVVKDQSLQLFIIATAHHLPALHMNAVQIARVVATLQHIGLLAERMSQIRRGGPIEQYVLTA